jgi:predicted Zn-dependent protease
MAGRLPTVSDHALERLVKTEAAYIVAASEDRGRFSRYQIRLSDFPRKDILGMSFGRRRIYISYQLAQLASVGPSHLWLLRQTLAHEVAHEVAGHAKQSAFAAFNRTQSGQAVSGGDVGLPGYVTLNNYSMEKELAADEKGLEYWRKLGWDCRIWVDILQNFEKQNFVGDALHPTELRLEQARRACRGETSDKMIRNIELF